MARMSDYKAPHYAATPDHKLGWLREASQEGENYLQNQRGYPDIDRALDIISGKIGEKIPKQLSRVFVNRAKRNLREIVATLSNIRPLWGYHTDNREFDRHAEELNKLLQAWYHMTFADRKIKKALQYAGGLCKGYIVPYWARDYWFTGRGDIDLAVHGPRDILPNQIGPDHDLQRAYSVDIRTELGINYVHALHPTFQDVIVPDRGYPSLMKKALRRLQSVVGPIANLAARGKNKEDEDATFPTVDYHQTYILDSRINNTGKTIPMGDVGTSWYYEVPSLGASIPSGIRDAQGVMQMRPAEAVDCLLYPLRRLMVWTNTCLIYDGTSKYWHGKVPAIPFSMDEWAWDFLGFSILRDMDAIQQDNVEVMRSFSDALKVRLRPPLQYDENLVSEALMNRLDPRQQGQVVGVNMQMGEAIKTLIPADYYNGVSQVPVLQYLKDQEERMDNVSGIRDVAALARARQIPSADSLEKIMELMGPLPTDMSRSMESSLAQLGETWKSLAFQFYNSRRKVQVLGKDYVTEEEHDFEPGNMIPSHMPDEAEDAAQGKPSRHTLVQRARWHQNNFYFHITPNSMHQITQMSKKLTYQLLKRSGFPLDPWTEAEVFDIPNFGPAPEGTKNVMERWVAWMHLQAELQKELGVAPKGQPGRKQSNRASPQVKTKEGGMRSTVVTSR